MTSPVRKIFEEVPKTYELINHVLTLGMDVAWRKKAVRIAAEGGGAMWMDICSGTGETAAYLRRIAPKDTTIISADFCFPMIQIATRKPEAKNIHFTLTDAGKLPFPDETFDLITISFATRNLNTSRGHLFGCFKEFHRVLKTGGRFVNLETSQPDSKFIRNIFHSFIGVFVRPIGKTISGSKAGYTYLSQTIPRFYDARELANIMIEAGFSNVTYQKMFFGAAAIHKAIK